jgi:hypothetical protein
MLVEITLNINNNFFYFFHFFFHTNLGTLLPHLVPYAGLEVPSRCYEDFYLLRYNAL